MNKNKRQPIPVLRIAVSSTPMPLKSRARAAAKAAIAAVRRLEELDPYAAVAVRDFINADELEMGLPSRFSLEAALRVVAIDTHERKLIAVTRAAHHDQPPSVVNEAVDSAVADFHEQVANRRNKATSEGTTS